MAQHRPHSALSGIDFGSFGAKTPDPGSSHPVGDLTQGRPHGALSGLRFGSFAGRSAVPAIDSITAGATSIVVAWSGTATEYRIDGGTPTALPDGISPDTITGLSPNTEYNAPGLQLRNGAGGVWSAAAPFGTLNPGTGGGDVPTGVPPGIAESSDAALALLQALTIDPALEADTALALPLALPPGVALETSLALALGSGAAVQAAEEADEALPLLAGQGPTAAVESDLALALVRVSGPGVAVETEAAFALGGAGPTSPPWLVFTTELPKPVVITTVLP